MKTPRIIFFVVVCALAVQSGASAATIFTATLSNGQESGVVVPTTSTGAARPASSGTATFTLNDAMTALTFTATINNIDVTGAQTADTNDNLVAAHIHAPAAPGTNAGVVWGFFGAPFNDNNPNDFVLTPFASGVGGTFSGKWDAPEGNNTTLAAQVPNLLAGLAYINFHTVQFGGGEIRGQIIPPAAVPDAGSSALLFAVSILGLLGVFEVRSQLAARTAIRARARNASLHSRL
jgi:hypothetical protein